MAEPRKKPKPKGMGNYTVCRNCRQVGVYPVTVAAGGGRKEVIMWKHCKECKGWGWTEAPH